jgi:hypothetical protein
MQSFYKGDIENFAWYSGKKVPNPCRPKRPNPFHFKNLNWKGRNSKLNNGPKKPLQNCFYSKLSKHQIKNCK